MAYIEQQTSYVKFNTFFHPSTNLKGAETTSSASYFEESEGNR